MAMNRQKSILVSLFATCVLAPSVSSTDASAQSTSPVATIAALPCSRLTSQAMPMQSFIPGSRPFGIPLRSWTSEAFDALRRRVDVCYAGSSNSDAMLASRQIDYFEQSAQPYIDQIARDADRMEQLKQSMLSEIDEALSAPDLSAAQESLDQVQRKFSAASFSPQDRVEVAAALDGAVSRINRRQRDEAEAKARDEKVRAAEAQARASRQAADANKAEADRQEQAAAKAASDLEERKRSHAARLQADADATAKAEAALKSVSDAAKESADAQKARSEAAERERASRDEAAKLETEERAASEARKRVEGELARKRAALDDQAKQQAFITPAPGANADTPNGQSNSSSVQAEKPKSMDSDEGVRFTLLAGAEAIFRVCFEDFGEYAAELEQVRKEGARLGQLLVSQNVLTPEKLAAFRERSGLTTGRGLVMLEARQRADPLGACEEAAVALNIPKN